MIPADVASRLQISADTSLRPVAPVQEISDRLSGLVAGQRVMAEIQALLPNGTYRAVINQRNVTLALPFSAKSGDALELQVTESDGRLALAVVATPDSEGGKTAASTSATLSKTGQLISTLFAGAREAKGGPVSLPLNENQPITNAPPKNAQDLLPMLKQAITQSGMFYEAHQAEWVEGRFTKAALLQEPQGKLSSPAAFLPTAENELGALVLPKNAQDMSPMLRQPISQGAMFYEANQAAGGESRLSNATVLPATTNEPNAMAQPKDAASTLRLAAESLPAQGSSKELSPAVLPKETAAPTRLAAEALPVQSAGVESNKASATQPQTQASGQLVAPQAQPVVQQQLEALATQNFSWQGQVWPGQEMRWEIDENAARNGQDSDETAPKWSTRLHLTLPNLGEVDAQVRLQGNQITLVMSSDNTETRDLMRSSSFALRSQLDEAGLLLTSMGVAAATDNKSNG